MQAGTSRAVDFGHPVLVVRAGPVSLRFGVRALVVCLALALIIVAVFLLSLGSGELATPPARVAEVLLGGGTDDERMVIIKWRMPRALMAIVAGAALAISGAIFQAMTRNPLGSPDVIGFTTGAYAGAVLSILVWRGAGLSTSAGALLGGVATAIAVYALAYRRGVQGFRLIIVGIGVSQILGSMIAWLILRAELPLAISAAVWGTGSLGGITWYQLGLVSGAVLALLPLIVLAAPALRALGLGDDAAAALGMRIRWTMLWLTVLGVALSAAVVAYCGLILFVSLAAPQLARRLTRAASTPLLPTALVGAALLSGSDWVAQHGLGADRVPVGVVTVSVGGAYLVWLLIQEARRR